MRVEPIRSMKSINAIKKYLADKPRDNLLFCIGINSGIRVCDLLRLRVNDVKDAKVGDTITITESKTGKVNTIYINKEIYKSIRNYLDTHLIKYDNEYLFKSRKGTNYPITTYAVTMYVKKWAEAVGLTKENYGAHTLRKTFCYIQRTKYGVAWETLSARLNHSSPSTTRAYLGVQKEEVTEILKHEI